MLRSTVLLGLLFSPLFSAFAQSPTPDCQLNGSFSSATAGPAFANKPTATGGTPCLYWVVQYWTNGASGVSVKLEGSADAAGVSSGSYTALTAASGSNPMTGTTQGSAVLCCDYYPWLRINPSTFAGTNQTMIFRAYGWRAPTNPSTGGGGPATDVNVADFGGAAVSLGQKVMASSMPVVIASNQAAFPVTIAANSSVNVAQVGGTTTTTNTGNASAGTQRVVLATDQPTVPVSFTAADPCYGAVKVVALINLTASARIVTGTSAKKTYICSVQLVAGAATNVAIIEGSGSTCGTSPLGLFGGATAATGWNLAANGGIAFGSGIGTLAASTVNANDICVLVSAANQISGSIAYVTQ
jgi:hypothetical protein